MNERSHIQTLSDRVLRQRELQRSADTSDDVGDEAPAARVPGLIANRYQLGARIGRWQLGDVYEAVDESIRDLQVERQVSVQVLDDKYAADRAYLDELRRGYAALRAGSHPNLTEVLEFSHDGNTFYLVMEMLEGASLRFVLDDAGALPFGETAAVIRAVGDALQYLHAKGLVHGNVKPESVFITDDYVVKLLDVVPASRPTSVPYYVEDIEAQTPAARDARDDVYGIACLTYELLSGRHPFNANSPLEAHRMQMRPAPIDALSHRQWLAVEGALALERDARTPTVAEYLGELGIKGTERLRVLTAAEAAAEPAHAPHRPEPRGDAAYAEDADDNAEHRRPDPVYARTHAPDLEPPRRTHGAASGVPRRREYIDDDLSDRRRVFRGDDDKRSTAGIVVALALVAVLGLVAYVYYAPLRESATELIATLSGEPSAAPGEPSAAPGEPSQRTGESTPDELRLPEPVAGDRVASSIDGEPPAASDQARDPAGRAADPPGPEQARPGAGDAARASRDTPDAGSATPASPSSEAPAAGGGEPRAADGSAAGVAEGQASAAPPSAQPQSPPTAQREPVQDLPPTPPASVAGVETPAAIEPPGANPQAPGDTPAAAGSASEARAAAARSELPPGAAPPGAEPAGAAPAAVPPSAAAPVPAAEPTFAFVQETVRVDEGAVAALVSVRRTGDLASTPSIVWWTADDSAVADEDYANLGEITETFAAGEATLSLYIPLVRDSIPEPTESFFVYIGRFDADRRHLEATGSVRVEIADDD